MKSNVRFQKLKVHRQQIQIQQQINVLDQKNKSTDHQRTVKRIVVADINDIKFMFYLPVLFKTKKICLLNKTKNTWKVAQWYRFSCFYFEIDLFWEEKKKETVQFSYNWSIHGRIVLVRVCVHTSMIYRVSLKRFRNAKWIFTRRRKIENRKRKRKRKLFICELIAGMFRTWSIYTKPIIYTTRIKKKQHDWVYFQVCQRTVYDKYTSMADELSSVRQVSHQDKWHIHLYLQLIHPLQK